MPPVMGAGAFILTTWTNIPYLDVAVAAIIPALLYYAALLAAIHFRAALMGIEPAGSEDSEPVMDRLHLLLPLAIIVLLLGMGRSPMRAAFWGVASAFIMAVLRPSTRPSLPEVREIMERAGRGAVQVAAACAAAGIVVGVASLTGIGLRMSELIITLSGGQLLPALVLTALGSIVLGMGLPTTAAYVVLAALGAPALVQLDVSLLQAHLFIFYFGCISNVTPPVSLAAFAAAGISGGLRGPVHVRVRPGASHGRHVPADRAGDGDGADRGHRPRRRGCRLRAQEALGLGARPRAGGGSPPRVPGPGDRWGWASGRECCLFEG